MPTQLRLMLSVFDGQDEPSTQVFDVFDKKAQYASTAVAVCSALRSLPPACAPGELLAALHAELLSTAAPEACADVALADLGVCLQNASARGALEEGSATFCVGGEQLRTAARALRASASAGGRRLELVALVHSTGVRQSARPAYHFVGSTGELVDVRSLQAGRKSVDAVPGSSHYMRRAGQLQAHAAAMQNLGLFVPKTETRRAHTLMLDAYVSSVETAAAPLRCLSVFV